MLVSVLIVPPIIMIAADMLLFAAHSSACMLLSHTLMCLLYPAGVANAAKRPRVDTPVPDAARAAADQATAAVPTQEAVAAGTTGPEPAAGAAPAPATSNKRKGGYQYFRKALHADCAKYPMFFMEGFENPTDKSACIISFTDGNKESEDPGTAVCELCTAMKKDDKKNVYAAANGGCKTGRINDVKVHCQSSTHHLAAMREYNARKRNQLVQGWDQAALGKDLGDEWLRNMIKVTFTMIMTNQPFSNFVANCLMVRWCGNVAMSVQKYLNRWMFKELLTAISAVVEEELISELKESPTFGV